jgi:succinyl-CoA synthetase beta subunit
MLTGSQALGVLAAAGIPVRDGRTPDGAGQRLQIGVALDREQRCFRLLGTRCGDDGVPADDLCAVTIDPALGPRSFLTGRMIRRLGLRGAAAAQAGEILRRLYEFAQASDACGIEAVLVTDGGAMAVAGASLELDPSGAFRQHELAAAGAFDVPGTATERALARAGAVGI